MQPQRWGQRQSILAINWDQLKRVRGGETHADVLCDQLYECAPQDRELSLCHHGRAALNPHVRDEWAPHLRWKKIARRHGY